MACHHRPPKFVVSPRPKECPKQTLTAAEVVDLSERGIKAVNANRLGEHHSIAALETGLPMLKLAAWHGDVPAMNEYANLIIWYGFIDNNNTPFMGRKPWQNAQEGLLFNLLAAHRDDEIWADDRETFTVLLDPSIPFPDGFFDNASGTAWLFQGWDPDSVDRVRIQAYHWKDCWSG